MYECILYEQVEQAAVITLNRPHVNNAMNMQMIREITSALERAERDSEVKSLIFIGAGDKAFSAGADIEEMANDSSIVVREKTQEWVKMFQKIESIPKPVIAAVSGYAPAGGTELTLACDFVITDRTAKFGLAEVNIGVIPGAGATVRLTRWIGRARAKEVLMTGKLIDAELAYEWGLSNKIVEDGEVLSEAITFARELSKKSPLSLAAVKRAVNIAGEMDMEKGIQYVLQEFALLFSSEDQKEGMKAFIEKRKPEFQGK
ncbi:enoyl-CoA hydratase/isomerase family protein [Rossellomorea marisflavi]|uniref:enoyl-CoA hydratase/isomerase family protein n=1 Tax=Rossellomorea marisflavi TaxID=189381 RepID=UPI0027A5C776|nr:enoyl-CoA hydratase/isomerase family protein [Rossellomorea marisflavi]UTE74993.1 enoyl-CoA hydratase/isomerase family protein [Rossellomorea marisflavi]